ncbi:hypothetical protein AGMMS50289_09720 [Betaproteobacteria bacterium]|nr:hypothetical protein AGMMS50289_09720 [Betaproteobacteria bacterium]
MSDGMGMSKYVFGRVTLRLPTRRHYVTFMNFITVKPEAGRHTTTKLPQAGKPRISLALGTTEEGECGEDG